MDRIKSEFISIVSHELRTPLTAIRGSLGLMAGAMAKELPDKANSLLRIACQNSERLAMLINDMLDIDKIASGQMRFDIREEALSSLILQAVESNRPYAEKLGVAIVAAPIDAELTVAVDPVRLSQVLANLLSNAAKFSSRGDKVEISAQASTKGVRILVADHGPGIGKDFQDRIFRKFSQADSSAARIKDGSGLGLHISKQLIEHMGGEIGFDTEIDKGTTFWVDIPAAATRRRPSTKRGGTHR
jgi:signal transduction histidine kinase